MPPVIIVGLITILFFSVIIHEVSHGLAALRNGDDTARVMGRLTLNPLPHIDPFGSLIFPILLVLMRSPVMIGWAKPVPINPFRFRDFQRGMLEVGASGPVSNLVLGTLFALAFRLSGQTAGNGFGLLLLYGVFINYLLALFNLIPVPPLDGSRILGTLLPFRMEAAYYRLERYGMLIVFALVAFGLFDFLVPAVNFLVEIFAGASISG
ncbi:MAG TPA: site-2 protease family protein [bacterium]|uniref:Peptidase family M50 n=1 Tax=candidate division TA06 bacterium ADurb.Bin417 TaxID=1852828 RepID=A0A1V5MD29_UNCT6|nr:MAG: Peptidase family M50 [candidate division TA06 bacterium ADurb.Bin417]HNQ35733.1 site-2 protease family protein [bacterium]HNS48573.1 site-2 protease family protein [bacterium]